VYGLDSKDPIYGIQMVKVTLPKDPTLGINLIEADSRVDGRGLVMIEQIEPGGSAFRSQKVQEGDVLCVVGNGPDMERVGKENHPTASCVCDFNVDQRV
jgi:hypothetical protein